MHALQCHPIATGTHLHGVQTSYLIYSCYYIMYDKKNYNVIMLIFCMPYFVLLAHLQCFKANRSLIFYGQSSFNVTTIIKKPYILGLFGVKLILDKTRLIKSQGN